MAKRPDYSDTVVKTLFAYSRNKCSFIDDRPPYSCEEDLTDPNWDEVKGQIAHIRGFAPGSARHDPTMSVEDCNGFWNLLLLCPNHHQLIDRLEPDRFTVEVLTEMKQKSCARGQSDWASDEQLTKFANSAITFALRYARVYEGDDLEAIIVPGTASVTATAHDATVETRQNEPDSTILAFLRNHFDQAGDQIRPPQIAEGTGFDERTVQLSLGRLHRAGRVQGVTVEEEDYPVIVTGALGS